MQENTVNTPTNEVEAPQPKRNVWIDKYQIPVYTDLKRADEILYATDTQLLKRPKTNYFALADLGESMEETAKNSLAKLAGNALLDAGINAALPGGYASRAAAKTPFGRGFLAATVSSMRQLAAGTLKDVGTVAAAFGQDIDSRLSSPAKDLSKMPASVRWQEKIMRDYKAAFSMLGPVDINRVNERLGAWEREQAKIDEFNQKVKSITDLITKRAGLDKTEKDGVMYDFGAGASSFLFSVGALAVTRNPALVAPLFGVMEGQGSYETAMEAGISPLKAYGVGKANAAWITATEMVGEGLLNKLLFTKGVLGKAAQRVLKRAKGKSPTAQITLAGAIGAAQGGVIEGVQETLQNLGSDVIMNLGGAQEKEVMDILQDALYAGLLAFPLGFGAGSVGGAAHYAHSADKIKQRLTSEGLPGQTAEKLAHDTALESVSAEMTGNGAGENYKGYAKTVEQSLTQGGVDEKTASKLAHKIALEAAGPAADFTGDAPAAKYARYAQNIKERLVKAGLTEEAAQRLAHETALEAVSSELTDDTVAAVSGEINSALTAQDRNPQALADAVKNTQKRDFAKEYDEIETRAKNKFKAAGLSDEEAALGAAVETNLVKMQAAHLGLTPELAEKSLEISFNQELSEEDAKIRFIGEVQTLSQAEQEAFYKNSKMTSYKEMLGELAAFRAGLSEDAAQTYAQAAAMYKSPHKEFAKFYEVAQQNKGGKQSYYTFTTKSGQNIDIPSDTILHDKKHPEMTAEMWEKALAELDNVQDYFVTKPQYGVGADVLLNLNEQFGAEITVLPSGRIVLNTAFKSTNKGITAWIKKEKAARTPYPFVFDSRPHDLEKSPGKFPSQPSVHSIADIVAKIKGDTQTFNQGPVTAQTLTEIHNQQTGEAILLEMNPNLANESAGVLEMQPLQSRISNANQFKQLVLNGQRKITVKNQGTGDTAVISQSSTDKIYSSAIIYTTRFIKNNHIAKEISQQYYDDALAIARNVVPLFENATYILQHRDVKGVNRKMKRYAAAVNVGERPYLVMISVKDNGQMAGLQLYDLQVENKSALTVISGITRQHQGTNSIDDLVRFVKGKLLKYNKNYQASTQTFNQGPVTENVRNVQVIDDFDDNASANAFVKSRFGNVAHGVITENLAQQMGAVPGEIRVYNSLKTHLAKTKVGETKSRLEQIKSMGYENPIDFIDDVMENLLLIQRGNDGSFLLTGKVGKNNTVAIKLETENNYYKVTTLMPRRSLGHKETVWEAAVPLRDRTRTTGEIGSSNEPIGPNGTISIAKKAPNFKASTQTFNQGPVTGRPAVDLTEAFGNIAALPTEERAQAVEKELNNLIGRAMDTATKPLQMQVVPGNKKHIKKTNLPLKKAQVTRHNTVLTTLEKIVNNSYQVGTSREVHSAHNSKEQTLKHKSRVEEYVYFEADVKIGTDDFVVRLAAERIKGQDKNLLDLYNIKIKRNLTEPKNDNDGFPTTASGMTKGGASGMTRARDMFAPDEMVAQRFKADVKAALKDDSMPMGEMIPMGKIPPLYTRLGISDGELKTNKTTLLKAIGKVGKNKHNVPQEVLEHLPALVADPKAVFKSLSTSSNPNGYIAILDAVNAEGKPIVAVISAKNEQNEFSFIPSVYERNNFDNFVSNTANENGVLYIKDETSLPSLHNAVLRNEVSTNSIRTKEDFVKRSTQTLNQGVRGKTTITSKDGFVRAVITAGQAADKSTFVHELAHVYLSCFQHVYGMEEYAAQRKHLDAWLGKPRGGQYSRAQQEKFAEGFEQFLKEGKAPVPYLRSVFEKFRAWIIRVYDGADVSKLSAAAREAYADMFRSEAADAKNTVEFYQSAKKEFGKIRATLEKIKQNKIDVKDLDGVDVAALRDFIGILKKPAPALPKRHLLTDLRRYGAQYANSGRIDKEAYKNARVYDKATGVDDKPADWLVKHGYMEDSEVQTYEEAQARDEAACELIERALSGEPVYKLEDLPRVELHDAYREAVNMAEDAIGADYKNYEKLLASMDALEKQGYRAVEKSDLATLEKSLNELDRLVSENIPADNGFNRDSFVQELDDLFKAPANKVKKITIGRISNQLEETARKHGLNLEGYIHDIDNSGLQHTRKRHGVAAREEKQGQLAVTNEDFKQIPDVIYNPDVVAFGAKNEKGLDLIIYGKNIPDGSSVYVEEVRTGKKTLTINSLRKYKTGVNPSSFAKRISNAHGNTSTISIVSKEDVVKGTQKEIKKPQSVVGTSGKTGIPASVDTDSITKNNDNFKGQMQTETGKLQNMLPPDAKPVAEISSKQYDYSGTQKNIKKELVDWYRKNLQGKTVNNPHLGEVVFTSKGIYEFGGKSLSSQKAILLHAIRQIVEKGRLVGSKGESGRKDGVIKFYFLQGKILLDGKEVVLQADIAEDISGKKFYYLSQLGNKNARGLSRDQNAGSSSFNSIANNGANFKGEQDNKKRTDANGQVSTGSAATQNPPTFSRRDLGAVLNNSLTKNNDNFKGQRNAALAAERIRREVISEINKRQIENKQTLLDWLNKATTPEEIRQATADVLTFLEKQYDNTPEGQAEHKALEVPQTDYAALKIKILKDINDINAQAAEQVKQAQARLKELNRAEQRGFTLSSEETAERKKLLAVLDKQLNEPYRKAILAAMAGIRHLPAADKGKFLRTFVGARAANFLPQEIDGILARAQEIEETNYKKHLDKKIRDILGQNLFDKSGSLKRAIVDGETLNALNEMKNILRLTPEAARLQLENNMQEDMARHEEMRSVAKRLENEMLSLVANGIKESSCELYKQVFDDLTAFRKAGRDAAGVQKMVRSFRTETDKQEALDATKKNKEMGLLKRLFIGHIANWESMLDLTFDKNIKEKYSLLNMEADAMTYAFERKQEVLKGIAGIYKLSSAGEVQAKINEMLKEEAEFINYSHIDKNPDPAAIRKTGEAFAERLNKMQLINIYIWCKNEVLATRLQNQYGGQLTDMLFNRLTAQDRKFGDFLQEEAERGYKKINEVFVREHGYDLPKAQAYFPSRVEKVETELDLLTSASNQSKNPSFTKFRSPGTLLQMKPDNPLNILFQHINKTAFYVFKSEKINQIRRVFLSPQVGQGMERVLGKDGYNQFKGMIDQIGVEFEKAAYDIDKLGNWLTNNYVRGAIALKPSIAVKQLVSAINYAENMPAAQWAKGFCKAVLSPKETIEFMLDADPYLRVRYESGGMNEALEKMTAASKAFGVGGKALTLTNLLSISTRLGDMGAIVFGGKPYVDYLMSQGKTKEEALAEFRKSTLRSQQFSGKSSLSRWQADGARSNYLMRALFAFRNTPAQYARKIAESIAEYQRGEITAAQLGKTVAIYALLNSWLYSLLTSLSPLAWFNGDDDKDEMLVNDFLFSPLNQMASALPMLAAAQNMASEMALAALFDRKANFNNMAKMPLLDDLVKMSQKAMKENIAAEDVLEMIITSCQYGLGLPMKYLTDIPGGVSDVFSGNPMRGFLKLLGYTKTRAEIATGTKEKRRRKRGRK